VTQARERFAGLQQMLLGFYEALPLGVIIFDRSGTILDVNPQQLENSGVSREVLVGRKVTEVFAGVMQRYGMVEPFQQLLDEGRPFAIHVEQYQPEYIKKRARFRLWGFAVVERTTFAVVTEGSDLVRANAPPEIIGASEKIETVFRFIERAARVTTTVLLGGESGTGKELVARAVHARSGRARQPFLALNCAALPGPLLESTLFGSEKGAFTGADRRTKGYFEAAEGGTLLLDEIGETSLEFQAKLLRVLQDGVVTRLGGTEPLRTDVRVICATNRDLEADVAARRFREDLFYRINILRLDLPPLRERPDDIPLLAQHFLDELDRKHQLGRKNLTPQVLDAFLAYRWPGNVRELANVLEAAYVTHPEQALGLEHFPNRIREVALLHATGHYRPHGYREALEHFRREYAAQVLAFAGGDMRRAAKLAGVNPSTLYRLGGRSSGE
jgi:transcriptional regulator with PAS, ATPase and Fis domain